MKKYVWLIAMLVAQLTMAQIPANTKERVAFLHEQGIKIESGSAVVWFPPDSLSASRMKEVVDTINLIIAAGEKLVGAPQSWQFFSNQLLQYYICPGNFVAYTASNAAIFMPLWRVQQHKAPWHHETMHAMLRSTKGNWNLVPQRLAVERMPLWFTEGLTEYLAMRIDTDYHLPEFDPHVAGGLQGVDASCRQVLKGPIGECIVEYVGRRRVLMELFTEERNAYGSPFYNCSCSFTKFLAEKYGHEILVSAIAAFNQEHEVIEKAAGQPMDSLRSQWLKKMQ